MKKIRLFILTMIFALSFVCSAFAEDTSDKKTLFTVTNADGTLAQSFEAPLKSVSAGFYDAPREEDKYHGSILAAYVIPKSLYPSGNLMNLNPWKDKLISDYGWTEDEINFACSNFCISYGNRGLAYGVPFSHTLSVDVQYTRDTTKDSWCQLFTVLKPYITSLERWTEEGYEFPESVDPNKMLPDLKIKLTKKSYTGFQIPITRFNWYLDWNYEDYEVYKQNPNGYNYEMRYQYRSVDLDDYAPDPSNTKLLDNGSVASNQCSFSAYEVGKKIRQEEGLSDSPNNAVNFVVYFRTYDQDATSNWQMWSFNSNYTDFFDAGACDPSGNRTEPIHNIPDVNYQPDGEEQISAGAQGFDDSEYNTTSTNNKDSNIYSQNAVSPDSKGLLSVLKSNVESIKDIASMLSACYQWLPSWLLALISASIGVIVVVGLVKIIFS